MYSTAKEKLLVSENEKMIEEIKRKKEKLHKKKSEKNREQNREWRRGIRRREEKK